MGSNGVGKTTLLKTVMGLMQPIKGSVLFQGEDVTNLSAHARAKAGMVLVPEGRQLFTEMTIYENLEMGAFSPGPGPPLIKTWTRFTNSFPASRNGPVRRPAP